MEYSEEDAAVNNMNEFADELAHLDLSRDDGVF